MLPDLKELAAKKFELACRQFWDSSELEPTIENVFTAEPTEDLTLREMVIATILIHPEVLNKNAIKDVVLEHKDLMGAILTQKLRAAGHGRGFDGFHLVFILIIFYMAFHSA